MSGFAQNLSSLRHDSGMSQKQAAEELCISQALLSHYENGIREPRLDFVVKVCEYYGVSADFMLGRTEVRENLTADQPADGQEAAASQLLKALAVTLRLLEDIGDERLLGDASAYVAIPFCKLFRTIESYKDGNVDAVSESLVRENALSDVAMKLALLSLSQRMRELVTDFEKDTLENLDLEQLSARFHQAQVAYEDIQKYISEKILSQPLKDFGAVGGK